MKKLLFLLLIVFIYVNVSAQESWSDYLDLGREQFNDEKINEAISSFEKAKILNPGLPTIWKELGDVYFWIGNYDEAIKNYDGAIPRYIDLGGIKPEVYNHRGESYRSKGEYKKAIEDFEKALELNENDADTWNYLGLAYLGKGDDDKANYDIAIEKFNKAIALNKYHAPAWNNRGFTYLEKGEYDKAISDYTQLISFNAKYDYAIVYSNRSRAYRMKKKYQKALADCEAALKIDSGYAPALNNRALAYFEMKQYDKAIASFKECLDASGKTININDISVYAWYLAAHVYEKYPNLKGVKKDSFWSRFASLALDGLDRGIKNAEDIRQNLGSQGAELMSQMIYLYYAGVDLATVMGSPEKVFFYSESLRSRGFLEQLGTEAAIRLPGISKEDYNKFTQLRATMKEQQDIMKTYNRAKPEDEANKRYALAMQQYKAAEEALAKLDKKLGDENQKYTALRNPKPVTLDQAKTYCGEDRAVLEYVLWDSSVYKPIKGHESWNTKGDPPAVNSYCLVITKDGLTAVPLTTGFNYHDSIQMLRDGFYAEFTAESSYEKPRNDLYNQLIKPVLPYLTNIKNITIVPDGELAMIPFDILRADNNSKDFGESYVSSLSPSLSVSILAQKEGSMSNSPILFFANDIYEGKKYPDGKQWGNLPGVNEEIKRLQELAKGQKKEFTSYFRENATKEKIRNTNLKKFPIIHFACHGYFNMEKPTESGLVLYQVSGEKVNENGYLTIPEVAGLDLNARMVVLSACETGLGKVKIGEGMVGLARAFMVAGAANVGVTLWEISDKAASPFMENLYKKVLEEGKIFREAYKEVKETFRSGAIGFKRPYYWAAFTMYE